MIYYPSIGINEDSNFKLRASTKGQLRQKKLYSAYNKNSLSSIPNNYEIFLIDKSNRTKSIDLQDIQRYRNTAIDKDKTDTFNQKSNFSHISLKGYGNGFASSLDRFDYSKENNEKYKPGPGEYESNQADNNDKNNNRKYKTLINGPFNMKVIKKCKESFGPGPGFYNPNVESCVVKNAKILNSAFLSKDIRFKVNKNRKVGPGSYELNQLSKWNEKSPSFFFKKPVIKKVINIEKYITTSEMSNQKKDNTPGPGHYIQKREFDSSITDVQTLKKAISSSYRLSNQDKSLIPKKLKEFKSLMKEERHIKNNIKYIDRIKRELTLKNI